MITLRSLVPPILWKHVRRKRKKKASTTWEYGEQAADFYDYTFGKHEHWRAPYTQSRYYPIWTVLVDRMKRVGSRQVLDIGCGPGQFACLLADRGIPAYTGLDFSEARIAWAREVCPAYSFEQADVFESDLLASDYDTVTCLEFLEHVERDLDVIQRLRKGAQFFGTVPDFPFTSHVRHFKQVDEVAARYGSFFRDFQVDTILIQEKKVAHTFFVMEGVVN